MNNLYKVVKRCLAIAGACCVILCIVFFLQIKKQKSQIQMMEQMEKEAARTMTELEEKREILSEATAYIAVDIQHFMQECEKIGQDMKSVEKKDAEVEIQKLSEKMENENPYFYNREQVSLQVHAEYHNGTEFVDEIADAEIYRVKTYEHGCVYRMIIYIEPFMSSWYFKSGEPLNIYFYVTADKIYRILPYAQLEPGGRSIDLYDDDNLLTETLDTDEKLQNNSIVVCQEEELQQEYSSITKDGNKITYCLSETKVNGEPGGEDLFVWDQGKGLVEFGTGFGPGPMDVHIDEIQMLK